MARIAGVDIPSDKRVLIALRYIYGVGPYVAEVICKRLGFPESRRVKDLTEEEVSKIRSIVENEYKVEGELRAKVKTDIKNLMSIRCYRGLRHQMNLPVHGQNTHSNARTRKGKKGKVVANKKKASK